MKKYTTLLTLINNFGDSRRTPNKTYLNILCLQAAAAAVIWTAFRHSKTLTTDESIKEYIWHSNAYKKSFWCKTTNRDFIYRFIGNFSNFFDQPQTVGIWICGLW